MSYNVERATEQSPPPLGRQDMTGVRTGLHLRYGPLGTNWKVRWGPSLDCFATLLPAKEDEPVTQKGRLPTATGLSVGRAVGPK